MKINPFCIACLFFFFFPIPLHNYSLLPLAQDFGISPDLFFFVDIFKISFIIQGIRKLDTASNKASFLWRFLVLCAFFSKLATVVERVTPCVKVKNLTFLDLFPISSSVLSSFTVFLFYHPSNVKIFCVLVLSCFFFMSTFYNSLVYY